MRGIYILLVPCAALLLYGAAQDSSTVTIIHNGTPTCPASGSSLVVDTSSGKLYACNGGVSTQVGPSAGGGVPTGSILMVNAGSCPAGYTELTTLSGLYPLGTKTANADVGTTGGSTSYTPAGSNSAPAFTGSAGTVPAETIAWPAGVPTNAGGAFADGAISWPVGVPTVNEPTFTITGTKFTTSGSGTPSASSFNGTTLANGSNSVSNPAQAISWPAGVPTIAAGTFTQPTVSWPAGVPTNSTAAFTPAGTVAAPAFTGTAATIQQPFEKVLFCKAP